MPPRHVIAGLVTVLALGLIPLGTALPAQAAPQTGDHAAAQAEEAPVGTTDAGPTGASPARAEAGADRAGDRTDTDDTAGNTTTPENTTDAAEEDGEAENVTERAGPPTDMPAQVPDHVERIHSTIRDYLQGEFERLGPRLQDIL